MIYFDNAATTLKKPDAVIDAVAQAMRTMGNSARGAYEGALDASRVLFDTRCALAELFGCARADHVAFTANSTQALNIAISGLLNAGDGVITTDLEHNSVLRPLYRLREEKGVQLTFVRAVRDGTLSYADFEAAIDSKTRMIVTTHASNLTGNLLDIARIGAIAHAHGLLYVVDASQTAGAFAIDMQAQNIDVLCFTGHKSLMGPQGTGGLCVAQGVEIRPWCVGGTGVKTYSQTQPEQYPVRLEAGTANAHGIAGLYAAISYIRQIGMDTIHAHETALMRSFYEQVTAIDGVTVYGDFSGDRAPIVALNIRDYPSSAVADELASVDGIAVRAGAHCAPRMHEALGTVECGAVRFSFGWFNTPEEVQAAIAAVRRIAL